MRDLHLMRIVSKTVRIYFLLEQQISTDCSIITDKDYKAFPIPSTVFKNGNYVDNLHRFRLK